MGHIRTLYQVIGVEPTASGQAIRAAYRARAQSLHPDTSDHPDASSLFAELASAYAVLSDPVKRRAYDTNLRKAPSDTANIPRPGANGPHFTWTNIASEQFSRDGPNDTSTTDFDEMYEAYFGAAGPEND